MEREKMIEEIARIICENEKPCYACLKCTIYDGKICCKYLRIAEKIVNLLIHEGAVVLTREEYERLASYISEERAREIFHEETEKLKEKIRKETAKEIYKRLCNVEYSIYDDAHGYAGALLSEFEKIFNENGMEVEE